jgi:hypothetical protein
MSEIKSEKMNGEENGNEKQGKPKLDQEANYLDTVLRQTRAYHTQLSFLADSKANILLTLSSLAITFLIPHWDNENLRMPIFIMSILFLLTVALAVYAVMPKSENMKSPAPDKKRNLLFFGDFQDLSFEEYEEKMGVELKDPEGGYRASLRDIHAQGSFLARKKYRYLRLAYITFLCSPVAGALAFLVLHII